ncbi:hypothetical protein ACTMU2_38030 [Cupriavidus basilensis]
MRGVRRAFGKRFAAIAPIAEGERVIEYKGEYISGRRSDCHLHDPERDPNHTFYFSSRRQRDRRYTAGNRARWINHVARRTARRARRSGRVYPRTARYRGRRRAATTGW